MTVDNYVKTRRRGLVWRATFVLVTAAIVPVLIFGGLTQVNQRATLTENAAENLQALADAQAARLDAMTRSALSNLGLIASRTQMRRDLAAPIAGDTSRIADLEQIIGDAAASTVEIVSVSLTDTDGQIIATTDPQTTSHEFAIATRLDLADPNAFDSEIRTDDGWPRWFIASPLHLNGEPVGAVVVEIDLDAMLPLSGAPTNGARITATCVFATTVDGRTTPLVSPGDTRSGRCYGLSKATVAPFNRQLTAADDGRNTSAAVGTLAAHALAGALPELVEAQDEDGQTLVAAVRAVPRVDWGVVVMTERAMLLEPVAETGRIAIALMLLLGTLAAIVAVVAARKLTRPIRQLRDVAVTLGHSDDVHADTNAPGEIGELAVTFNELAARVRAEQRAKEHQYAELEVLTHAMAHDLKGPLTNLRGLLETLQSGRVSDTAQRDDLLDRSVRAAVRMQDLITDLLALMRSIGDPLDHQPVDLAVVVRQAARDVGADGSITIGPLPAVRGDAVLLERLFVNVLDNSMKYHAAGKTPTIEVSAAQANDSRVDIYIDDAGIGIPEGERQRVLKSFARGSASLDHRGSGLGLAIVATIVDLHGGAIDLGDSPLGGTRITVTLPVPLAETPPSA